MSYEEALEATIPHSQALAEVKNHGIGMIEFYADLGAHPFYSGEVILHWLGY